MKMINLLRRLNRSVKAFKNYYKYGGCVQAEVSICEQPTLLKDKNILITGGSSGIGLSMAKKFLACGANVVITGRNPQKLEDAENKIKSLNCKAIVWDHTNVDIIPVKLAQAKDFFDRNQVDILVNNAGIPPSKFWGEVDENEWDRIFNTNLKSTYFLTQEIVKLWKEECFKGYKKILNISSQGGFVGATYPYRMAKWDLRGLTEGLGKSLISDNIIVNSIAPGIVKTEMQRFSLEQGDNLYTNQNPINRVCLPEEISELAAFLISDTSNFIIGQTIVCDGGYTLK